MDVALLEHAQDDVDDGATVANQLTIKPIRRLGGRAEMF